MGAQTQGKLKQMSERRKELLAKNGHSQNGQDRQQTVEQQMQAYKINMVKGTLTVEDLKKKAEKEISFCQNQKFQDEVSSLEKGNHNLKRNGPLYKLDLVLQEGLLRVGGRLSKSSLPAEAINPAVVPKDSHITILILRDIDEKVGHCGRNYMLSQLRQRFWIPIANSTVRKFSVKMCYLQKGQCQKERAKDG